MQEVSSLGWKLIKTHMLGIRLSWSVVYTGGNLVEEELTNDVSGKIQPKR